MKYVGKNLELLEKINEWIEETFIYKDTPKIPGESEEATKKRHYKEYKDYQQKKAALLTDAESLMKK